MRIVLDARMVKMSGIGRYIDSLIPFLARSFKLTLLGNPLELEKYGTDIIGTFSRTYSPFEQAELPLKIPRTDLFWTPHFNAPILPVRAAKKAVTIHDVFHLAGILKDRFFRSRYTNILYSNAIRSSDAIFTVSEFTKTEILRFFPEMAKKSSRIMVIPRYPDPKFRNLEMSMEKKNEFLDKKKLPARFALYVGNIKPHKNIEGLLNTFGIIRKGGSGLSLVCVGQKEKFITGFEGAEKVSRSMGLGNTVFFTGILEDEELVKLYNCAEVLVLPSFYEGFGLPPLEAMACGCPVAVSDINPLKEICSGAAVYFNPASADNIAGAILNVTGSHELRERMISEGFLQAAKFTREKVEQEYLRELDIIFREI